MDKQVSRGFAILTVVVILAVLTIVGILVLELFYGKPVDWSITGNVLTATAQAIP